MPSVNFRGGGTSSEYIAEYLLSQFSFVSGPRKGGDDVGGDETRTFFSQEGTGNRRVYLPEFTFAVQVKNNRDNIEVRKDHYKRLAGSSSPPYLAVVDKRGPGPSP